MAEEEARMYHGEKISLFNKLHCQNWMSICASCHLQLFATLWMSPLGFPAFVISQARILEWIVISFSRGYSWLRDRTCVSCSGGQDYLPLSHLGSWWKLNGHMWNNEIRTFPHTPYKQNKLKMDYGPKCKTWIIKFWVVRTWAEYVLT